MNNKFSIDDAIREYGENVRLIAKKFFISDGSVDDLYQEGLIGLIQGYNNYDKSHGELGSEPFKSFLLMCAKRRILDAVKRSNSKRNSPMNNFVSLTSEDFVETSNMINMVEEPLEDKVINKLLEESEPFICVNLSEFERQVLDLELEGLKQSEIAERLNKPVKSIDNTIQRIKTKLKRNM